MDNRIHGIFPALVTPLTPTGELAEAVLEQLIERLYGANVDGLYVCGQTGEGLLLDLSTRKRVTEIAVRCSPRGKPVVTHVGAARTGDAIALGRAAMAAGATAIASLPPLGPYSFEEIRGYYQRLAGSVDGPLLVYYFPEVAPGISPAQVGELGSISGVIGAKFTDFDLFRMSQLAASGLTLLNGRDEVLVAGLLMGAHGGVGTFYNLVPEIVVGIYRAAKSGDWADGRRLQDRLNHLIALTIPFGVLPAAKTMLGWSGLPCGPCVEPRRSLSGAAAAALRANLEKAGFSAEAFAASSGV